MPHRGRPAEPARETLQQLGGERDFRQQHQRPPAALERGRHRFQIDLGLAGAWQTLEQGDGMAAPDAGAQPLRRLLLVRRQRMGRAAEASRRLVGLGHRDRREQAGLDHPLHHARADPGCARQLRRKLRRARGERIQHLASGGGQPGLAPFGRGHQTEFRRWRLQRRGDAQCELQRTAQRMQRDPGEVIDQLAQRARHRRSVQLAPDRLQALSGHRPVGSGIPRHADHLARPEWHLDVVARP